MAKKRGQSKKKISPEKPVPTRTISIARPVKRGTSPGRIISAIVVLILIVAFIALAVSVFQQTLSPQGITLTPYVYDYIEAPKDYVPKLALSDSALELNSGEMVDVIMFLGNNKDMQKDFMLDITCEARTAQGCAFIDLKHEHLVTLPAKTVQAYPLEITTTDQAKQGIYDVVVEASIDGKTYASESVMLDIR